MQSQSNSKGAKPHMLVLSSKPLGWWERPGMLGYRAPPCETMKESACNAGDAGSIPGSGRSPWRRKWQPTPVFLPGKSHGHGSLVGYSPWDCKRIWHDLVTKQQQSVHMSIPISQFIPSTLTPLESMFVLYICFSNLFSTSVFEISAFQISSSEDTLLFK